MAGDTVEKEKLKGLYDSLEKASAEGVTLSNEELAAAHSMSLPTARKYRSKWEKSRRDEEDMANSVIRKDPLEIIENML